MSETAALVSDSDWQLESLGLRLKTKKGKKPNLRPDPGPGRVPYIDIATFESGVARQFAEISSAKLAKQGDLLMVWDGARSGLVGRAPFDGAIGSTLTLLEHPAASSEFLFHFLRTQYQHINSNPRGTGIPHVNPDILADLQFPIIPPILQNALVGTVEAIERAMASPVNRLATIPALLKKFRQSVLADACSGQLTADWRTEDTGVFIGALEGLIEFPSSWQVVPISSVTESLDQGWSPKCHEHTRRAPDSWAVLKTSAIEPMRFVWEAHKELPMSLEPREILEARAGDLLITRAGPRSRCAVSCLIRKTPDRLMICDKMYRLRLSRMMPAFLEIVLNSPVYIERLDDMKTGISDSGLNLTQKGFLAIEVPFPNMEEQAEIVRRVESLFALADSIESRLAEATVQVERTTQAILAKAFRGDLTGGSDVL